MPTKVIPRTSDERFLAQVSALLVATRIPIADQSFETRFTKYISSLIEFEKLKHLNGRWIFSIVRVRASDKNTIPQPNVTFHPNNRIKQIIWLQNQNKLVVNRDDSELRYYKIHEIGRGNFSLMFDHSEKLWKPKFSPILRAI